MDNTTTPRSHEETVNTNDSDLYSNEVHKSQSDQDDLQKNLSSNILPHPRTLRKAREQVKMMVCDGFSARFIRSYLHRWVLWWLRTADIWNYD